MFFLCPRKSLCLVKGMLSNSDSGLDVFRACAEHSWQAHGPGGRDGQEGRYAKHGINSVDELESHIRESVNAEQTKGFIASNDREVYMSAPNANRYSTEVILNYQKDKNGNVKGDTCVLTDRPEAELKRLQEREKDIGGKAPELKLQNAYAEIRKELPRENKQQERQVEPEKQLTWYEAQQKRADIHKQKETQNKQQKVVEKVGKKIDKKPEEQPEEQLLDRSKKREQDRQKQHKDKDRGFRR